VRDDVFSSEPPALAGTCELQRVDKPGGIEAPTWGSYEKVTVIASRLSIGDWESDRT